MYLVSEFVNLICKLFAFIYGAHVSFKKGGVLFLQIVTCAFGCFSLGSLYNLCYSLCMGDTPNNNFNIGGLGYIGGMFFLFSSYYGAMDRIGDNKNRDLRAYKIFSFFISSVSILFCDFMILRINVNVFLLLSTLLSSVVMYFALKHLILPDIEDGIIRVMRPYNFLISILCVIQNLYNISYLYESGLSLYLKFALCIITVLSVPVANKGVRKWST